MSEKRLKFTLESDRQYIGILDEGYDLTGFEVCNLLNSLYQQCEALQDENEQLKNYFKKRAECSNFQINKLKEEIAELQEDNVDTIVELSKENEQLQKENSAMKEEQNEMIAHLKKQK